MAIELNLNMIAFMIFALIMFKINLKFNIVNFSEGRFYIKGFSGARKPWQAALTVIITTFVLFNLSNWFHSWIISQSLIAENIGIFYIVFFIIAWLIFTGW